MKPGALIFDVFGTCVDWRRSIAASVGAALPNVNALDFADAWRGEYQPAMERIRTGGRGYVLLDDLHHENLLVVLDRFGVSLPDTVAFARAWERLTPWPDVVSGLAALRQQAVIAPCSNGSVSLMVHLARYARIEWDCILGAEIARDYKPKASVYLAACAALRLDPSDVMMVAAHNDDLRAARAVGLKTAFVPRPTEHGPHQTTDLLPDDDWDALAPDFEALARTLFG